MKRLLPLLAVVGALAAAAIITVVAVGASSGSLDKSARQAQDSSGDVPGVAAMCAKDVPDCNDMGLGEGDDGRCAESAVDCVDTTGGGSMNMCIAPDNPGADDAVAAPECNDVIDGSARCAADAGPDCEAVDKPPPEDPGVQPPSGATTSYDLTFVFNESVTQDDLEEVGKIIQEIAPGGDFLVRESFPPVGAVQVTTDMAEFCPDIEAKFESLSYVADVTCGASISAASNPPDADQPVSSEAGAAPSDTTG